VPAPAAADATQLVAAARTRAKRRMLGAVVLLGIGVIAFPLLFETQPRPIPVDIPIEIPRKEGAAPLVMPPARQAPAAATVASEPASSGPVVAAAKPEATKEIAAPPKVSPKPVPVAKAAEPVAEAKAPAKAEVKPAAEAPGRFVVQIGAFADANGVREVRAKVEKLGLRTYTQSIDTDSGKRIRVRLGPFVSREEADQAADKVKAAGLPAAVLAL